MITPTWTKALAASCLVHSVVVAAPSATTQSPQITARQHIVNLPPLETVAANIGPADEKYLTLEGEKTKWRIADDPWFEPTTTLPTTAHDGSPTGLPIPHAFHVSTNSNNEGEIDVTFSDAMRMEFDTLLKSLPSCPRPLPLRRRTPNHGVPVVCNLKKLVERVGQNEGLLHLLQVLAGQIERHVGGEKMTADLRAKGEMLQFLPSELLHEAVTELAGLDIPWVDRHTTGVIASVLSFSLVGFAEKGEALFKMNLGYATPVAAPHAPKKGTGCPHPMPACCQREDGKCPESFNDCQACQGASSHGATLPADWDKKTNASDTAVPGKDKSGDKANKAHGTEATDKTDKSGDKSEDKVKGWNKHAGASLSVEHDKPKSEDKVGKTHSAAEAAEGHDHEKTGKTKTDKTEEKSAEWSKQDKSSNSSVSDQEKSGDWNKHATAHLTVEPDNSKSGEKSGDKIDKTHNAAKVDEAHGTENTGEAGKTGDKADKTHVTDKADKAHGTEETEKTDKSEEWSKHPIPFNSSAADKDKSEESKLKHGEASLTAAPDKSKSKSKTKAECTGERVKIAKGLFSAAASHFCTSGNKGAITARSVPAPEIVAEKEAKIETVDTFSTSSTTSTTITADQSAKTPSADETKTGDKAHDETGKASSGEKSDKDKAGKEKSHSAEQAKSGHISDFGGWNFEFDLIPGQGEACGQAACHEAMAKLATRCLSHSLHERTTPVEDVAFDTMAKDGRFTMPCGTFEYTLIRSGDVVLPVPLPEPLPPNPAIGVRPPKAKPEPPLTPDVQPTATSSSSSAVEPTTTMTTMTTVTLEGEESTPPPVEEGGCRFCR